LNNLLFWDADQPHRSRHCLAVHQPHMRIELIEKIRFQLRDFRNILDGSGPYKGNFPDIHLPVGNDV
jgi:hypothetical protein